MMYIMLAYLMLLAALSNAACLYDAFCYVFLPLIFANAFCFMLGRQQSYQFSIKKLIFNNRT